MFEFISTHINIMICIFSMICIISSFIHILINDKCITFIITICSFTLLMFCILAFVWHNEYGQTDIENTSGQINKVLRFG